MQKYKFKPLHNHFVNITEKMKTSLNNIKSSFQMKTYIGVLVVAIALLTACSTPQGAASSKNYQDDIYYSSKDAAADKERIQLQKQREQEEEAAARKKEAEQTARNAANTNSSDDDDYYKSPGSKGNSTSSTSSDNSTSTTRAFDYDDYYDYEYAVRLKRFHNSIPTYGYYDNFYTNSYWYTGNPYNYGTSVYMGYNFWGPSYYTYSYYPTYSYYSSWGWGYDPWYNPYGYYPYAYNPYFYNPYFYNPYGYYSHWHPYCYTNNYFNSYDRNSYYGPRNSLTAGGRRASEPTMAHRYMDAIERETQKPFSETKGRTNNPYMNTTRPSNQSNISVDPIKQTEVNEPRGGTRPHINTDQPGKQTNINNGGIELDRPIEVVEPRRGTHPQVNPGTQSNQNNGGVDPGRDTEIKNTQPQQPVRPNIEQPTKQSNSTDGIEQQQPRQYEQPSRQYEQPSRPIEPSRSPQFEQPRNSGSQSAPRGGSSSPSTNRPRR